MTALTIAPIDGEIIGPGESVTIIVAPHPLRLERQILTAPAGWSIGEIVRLAEAAVVSGRRMRSSWLVSVEGEPVPADWYERVRVKAGKTVVLRARASGGGGGILKSILMLVVAVLTAFIAPYLVPVLGAFGAALAVAAISVGASLILNALFPAATTKDTTSTLYSISGNQNLADKYGPVPVILGKIRVSPRYGASAYSEFDGDDQILRLLYVWGYGPLDITDIKIGDTPIAGFKDVDIETGYGYPTDGQPTLYPGEVIQVDLSIDVLEIDGWITRTTSEDITEWAIDLIAPSGLYATNNKAGEVRDQTVVHNVQYSVAYANDWISLPDVSMAGSGSKVIRQSVTQKVPVGQYDIRIQRVTDDFTDDARVNMKVNWTALRSYRPGVPLQFPFPVAWTALKIRATAQLNGVVDNLNGIVTSRVKAWNGTEWVDDTPSQNPADLMVHVLQCNANARPVADRRIDWAAMQAFNEFCVAQGWKYNATHDKVGSVKDAVKAVAAAGRAVDCFRDGLWSVVWEDADDPITQHYTPRNSYGFKGTRQYSRLPHGIRVQFTNEGRQWQPDEIVVYRDGYDKTNATLLEQIPFQGITDHTLNWRLGRYHLAQIELRPETYTLNIDIESFVNTRGDRVRVTHDAPMWGLTAGRVTAIDDQAVTLDEVMLFDPAKSYAVRFRLSDGSSLYRTVMTGIAGETYSLQLVGNGSMPEVGDLAMFGEAGTETVILRVLEIRAGDDMSAEVDFVDDAPAILLADQGEIPPFDSQITTPADPATFQPYKLAVTEGYTDASTNYAPTATLIWSVTPGNAAVTFQIMGMPPGSSKFTTSDTVTAPTRTIVWQGLAPGSWTFQVRAVFGDGSFSLWSAITVNLLSYTRPPPDVTGFAVNQLGDNGTFTFNAPQAPVAYGEIRYSPVTTDADWGSSTVLVSRTSGVSATAPFTSGSYLMKFVSYGGVYSVNAAIIVADGASLATMNVVDDIFEMEPFRGAVVDVYDNGSALQLAYAQDEFDLADWFGVSDFFMSVAGVASTGTYDFADIVDLGEVYTSRVSGEIVANAVSLNTDWFAVPDIFADPDWFGVDTNNWSVDLEMRITSGDPADPSSWSDWQPFVIGDYTARAYQPRLVLSSDTYGLTPVVTMAHVRIDMPDRDEVGKDMPVPIDGLRVTFSPPFRELKAVAITGQGMATGDYLDWGSKDTTGFSITIRDAAGDAVPRTIDYIAKGYGRAT